MLPTRDPRLNADAYPQQRQRLERDLARQLALLQQPVADGVRLFVQSNQRRELCLSYWDLWQLDYRGGRPWPELTRDFAQLITQLVAWHQSSQALRQQLQQEFPKRPIDLDASPLDFSQLDDYRTALALLSVGLVLRDAYSVRQLIELFASNRDQDELYELLISAYVDEAEELDGCLHPTPDHELLVELFFEPEPAQCQQYLQQYLSSIDPEFGWEVAAVCYLLDFNDQPLHAIPHYPADLVRYGQQLRDTDQWTSQDPD